MMASIRKVLDLFGAGERWKLLALFALMLTMALVQTVGVASVLPFMSLVADPASIHDQALLSWLYESLGFESSQRFLVFVGFVVLGIMAFSNAFSAMTSWAMLRFVWNRQYQLSVRLLARYLQAPYIFFLDRNSGALAKNILAEVKEAINGFVMPTMKAVAQATVAICIITLLVWVDVILALVSVIILGGSYGMLYAIVRRKQIRLGRERLAANELRFKSAGEAFGGIKEVKVLGRERELLKRFSRPARTYSQVNATNAIISELPRFVLETVAFGGILVIVLYILATREDIGQAVAVMSLYALAGYRLMPALQQVFSGFAKARFFGAALDNLHAELAQESAGFRSGRSRQGQIGESLAFERDIIVDEVSFRYPNHDEFALRNVSLRIQKNTTIGLAGSTGAGKTTLVDVLLGLLEPQEGVVRIDGIPLSGENGAEWRRRLGYVPQEIFLLDDTLSRNIAFGLPDDEIDLGAVERAARIAHLHDFVSSLANGYDTMVGERGVRLSGGQRQRIGIARALYHEPDVLMMDEGTSALDGITEDGVIQAVSELSNQITIILIAHRLITLRDCETIYFLERGETVASGSHEYLMETNSAFRAMARGLREKVAAP